MQLAGLHHIFFMLTKKKKEWQKHDLDWLKILM